MLNNLFTAYSPNGKEIIRSLLQNELFVSWVLMTGNFNKKSNTQFSIVGYGVFFVILEASSFVIDCYFMSSVYNPYRVAVTCKSKRFCDLVVMIRIEMSKCLRIIDLHNFKFCIFWYSGQLVNLIWEETFQNSFVAWFHHQYWRHLNCVWWMGIAEFDIIRATYHITFFLCVNMVACNNSVEFKCYQSLNFKSPSLHISFILHVSLR